MPRHATLDTLLRAHNLQETFVVDAVNAARAVFDPRRLRADQPYRLVRTIDGLLREFEYQIDTDRFLRIVSHRGEDRGMLDAEVVPYEKQSLLGEVYENAKVVGEDYDEAGAHLKVRAQPAALARLQSLLER